MIALEVHHKPLLSKAFFHSASSQQHLKMKAASIHQLLLPQCVKTPCPVPFFELLDVFHTNATSGLAPWFSALTIRGDSGVCQQMNTATTPCMIQKRTAKLLQIRKISL